MSLLRRLTQPEERSLVSMDEWVGMMNATWAIGGNTYTQPLHQTLPGTPGETVPNNFEGYARRLIQGNGPVWAVTLSRAQVFSQIRFQWQRYEAGRPQKPFGDTALAPLEKPWPGASTADLLTDAELKVTGAGNAYYTKNRRGQVVSLRPDWVTIVRGTNEDVADSDDLNEIESYLAGFWYHPGGIGHKRARPIFLMPEEVAHYAPYPDPLATWRGMSWLTPVLREIGGDDAATAHKQAFFENGATPNLVVTLDKSVAIEMAKAFKESFDEQHAGVDNAYKTLFLGGGADVQVVGQSFEQINFKATQGAGETRIAAAGGVPPVLVGLSEGLQAATYSNYGQARRRYVDMTMEHLWRSASTSFERLVSPPVGAVLTHDTRDMPFLREDQKDQAEIQAQQASAMRQLTDGGFEPASVVAAVLANDYSLLTHTGLVPVQLQPPGTGQPPPPSAPALTDGAD